MLKGIKEFMKVEDINSRKQIKSNQIDRLRIEEYKSNLIQKGGVEMKGMKKFMSIENMDTRKENKRKLHSDLRKEEFRMELR